MENDNAKAFPLSSNYFHLKANVPKRFTLQECYPDKRSGLAADKVPQGILARTIIFYTNFSDGFFVFFYQQYGFTGFSYIMYPYNISSIH